MSHKSNDPKNDKLFSDGAYQFKIDKDHQYPLPYAELDTDVVFEHGRFID